mmetsp:Transcript_37071/g.66755  ORF Transcript_37071/g.66755 Transcript_37071/m.66755 type:complete len:584 (-) Transcript_37071:195-1946(-)
MASYQQPAPPTNPFAGFDNYSTVAQQPSPQQPPQQQPQQQQPPQQYQQPVSPNQWGQQPPQPAAYQQTASATGSPTMVNNTANSFGFSPSNTNANPFAGAPGGFAQPAQPAAPMAQQMALAYPQQQQPPPQQQQQQLVPLAPNAIVQSPWALNPVQQQPPVGGGALVVAPPATDDPFGIFGASVPPQQLVQQPQLQAQPHPYALHQHPVQSPTAQQNLQNEMQQFNLGTQNLSILPDESEDEALAMIDVELDDDSDGNDTENLENRRKDAEFIESTPTERKTSQSRGSPRQPNAWDRNADIAPPPPLTPGRRHAQYLSQNSAPALSSPLPKPELVHHSGYVLSRISFRTVLMRRWKQTFWIQYGPTQLLFFRTFSDYEDWLNNPYHTIKAREFLVKLRVDFVSDLKKSSVMGYQVTQVRRKPYGKNVMLHFKLERWMDYGPTIAAAFAAREEEMMNSPSHGRRGGDDDGMNTSNDVAALRKIVLGCMRNARDAAQSAMVASRQQSDMGEAVGYRGRYDAEHQRDARIPSGPSNMGYHQAYSAERSERRPMAPDSEPYPSTESSQDELETKTENVAPPVVDLLG